MKITKVSFERLDLKLKEPYTIAYETVSSAVNFILKIETDSKIVGYGCAAPDKEVTQETVHEVESNIKSLIVPFLKGKNPYMVSQLLEGVSELVNKKSSTLAMVDMALMDIVSRKTGVPLYQFLGGYRDHIPTSITIGILPLQETLLTAEEYISQGFFILKIKGGLSLGEDIEKMVRLREKFPDITLRFDGNQGYSVEEALGFFAATKDLKIEIFEQPTKVGSGKKIGAVTEKVAFPVMGDESVKSLQDAYHLAHNKFIDMVNIKLMKVGGIREGMHINSVAKAAGLEAMVGCLDECSLGIAAGLHFALSRPNIQYADLDGHLGIENDPFKGLFKLENGILYPSKHPGLGKIKL
ncbi:mandelate racemase/muconate lactonizing enzyme family protein [Flagellimonas flava]|uniref:mandelate racemase/muconate lactonizing enzyme family protein n=1 Tax=Flagellimonas flava TaxID=570519 RepID=UPI003D646194